MRGGSCGAGTALSDDKAEAFSSSLSARNAAHSFILHRDHVVVTATEQRIEGEAVQLRRSSGDDETTIPLRQEHSFDFAASCS